MMILVFLVLMGINTATSRIHSLKYLSTASFHIPNLPEFVTVGFVDDVEMFYYDSNRKRAEPKQDWMRQNTDPQYWETATHICLGAEQWYKPDIETVMQGFNQTGGVHIFQRMNGCEWDDETGEVKGIRQYGYDGEGFITYDQMTGTWIALVPEAVLTKLKWDADRARLAHLKSYFNQECPDWLKKFVDYGRSSLLRTVLPSVSLLQKSPSSPVSCHATGFYPNTAMLFWRKDGEELHEDVDQGEILPNQDGTFQMRSDLQVASVPPEDWGSCECVFQLSGETDEIITKLDEAAIRTNSAKSMDTTIIIIIIIIAVLVAVVCLGGFGFFMYMKKKDCDGRVAHRELEVPPHGSDDVAWQPISQDASQLDVDGNGTHIPTTDPPTTVTDEMELLKSDSE